MNQSGVVQKLLKEQFKDKFVRGVEIGTGGADLTLAMLSALPNCFLYTIDPWKHKDVKSLVPGDELFEAGKPQKDLDAIRKKSETRLSDPEYKDRVEIIPLESSEVVSRFSPDTLDFVWIDGDHSKSGITKDLELYYPLVKKGGIFGGHDYLCVHPLTEIIKEKFGDRIITGEDFVWYVIK